MMQKGMSNIFNKVTEIMVEEGWANTKEEVEPTSLLEDFNMDSLDMIELIMAAEEEFNIDIPDKDWLEFNTVEEVINYLEQRLLGQKLETKMVETVNDVVNLSLKLNSKKNRHRQLFEKKKRLLKKLRNTDTEIKELKFEIESMTEKLILLVD